MRHVQLRVPPPQIKHLINSSRPLFLRQHLRQSVSDLRSKETEPDPTDFLPGRPESHELFQAARRLHHLPRYRAVNGDSLSGTLQGVHEVVQADARLTQNTLERACNQVAMHRHRDAPIPSGQANMRAGLSGNREAQPLQGFERFGSRNVPGATSRLNQDRIADEVDADSTRSGAFVKVNCDRVRDLLLQIAEVLSLRGDATRSIRVVPACHEPARLLVTLDLKGDFFHRTAPPPYLRLYFFIL